MERIAQPRGVASPRPDGIDAVAARVPVRYVHDPATDTWSFTIDIPPVAGHGCGCREVAQRSAVAALKRQLAACAWPRTDSEQIGYLSLVLGPVVEAPHDGDRAPVAPGPAAPVRVGFHPFSAHSPGCGSVDEGVAVAPSTPVAAPVAELTGKAAGFHPHSLRTPAAEPVVPEVTLTGTATVTILDPASGEPVGDCSGPHPDGSCPAVQAGAQLPCGGLRIRGRIHGTPRRFQFDVSPDAERCPLGWLVESVTREAVLGYAKE